MKSLSEFPKQELAVLPTPLTRAFRLEQHLGSSSPRIWIKRDDLTALAFGGNKARKLEFLVGDAIERGATVLVTEGGVQSNHARMTAAAAVIVGMRAILVLDTRRAPELEGNLLLDELLGAEVHLVRDADHRKKVLRELVEKLQREGEKPYLIPTGGSVPIGALGYVQAVQELQQQFEERNITPFRIYSPTGSQGTLAGLIVGCLVSEQPTEVYGVAVEHPGQELKKSAEILIRETLELLECDMEAQPQTVIVDDGYVGEGYGIPTKEGLEAIKLLARLEAIFLDPVYSSKAMAALLAHIADGSLGAEQDVVFLHTGGGPSLFAYGQEIGSALQASPDLAEKPES